MKEIVENCLKNQNFGQKSKFSVKKTKFTLKISFFLQISKIFTFFNTNKDENFNPFFSSDDPPLSNLDLSELSLSEWEEMFK